MPVQKKAWSRSPSIDHCRSISICNIPVPNEAASPENDEEYDSQQIKNIEKILFETDEEICVNRSYSKIPGDPIHSKAFSEDLAKPLASNGSSGRLVNKGSQIGVDLTSNDINLFYPQGKNMDETKVVTDLLNLQLESETSSVNNH